MYDLLIILSVIVVVFLFILNIVMIVRFFQMSNDLRDLRNHFITSEKEGIAAEASTTEASVTEEQPKKQSLGQRIKNTLRERLPDLIYCVVGTIIALALIYLVCEIF